MSSKDVSNWQSGLFGCFEDCNTCCYGCWCPCFMYGENVHKTEGTGCYINCCLWYLLAGFGCQCLAAGPNRTSMRTKYGGLREEPCNDCCTHCTVVWLFATQAPQQQSMPAQGNQYPPAQQAYPQGNYNPPAHQAYSQGNQGYPTIQH
eukprot:jgi/Astpho2/4112/Aster-01255